MENPSFGEGDWEFIRGLSERFPDRNIEQNFREFLEMPARIRPKHAAFRLNLVPRRGFIRIGIPENEGQPLADHVRSLQEMVALSPPGIDRERLFDILTVHDMAEVIVSDFTPVDPITKSEKYRLEKLAMLVIYENEPDKIALWEEYAANRTEDAHWAKDLDKLELVLEVEQQEKKHPRLKDIFNEFRHNAREGLQTDQGRRIFNYVRETPENTLPKSERIRDIAAHCAP